MAKKSKSGYTPKSKRNDEDERPYEETGHISEKKRRKAKKEADRRYMRLVSSADVDF